MQSILKTDWPCHFTLISLIHRFGFFTIQRFFKKQFVDLFVSVFEAHYHLLNQSDKAQHSYASLQKACAQICD